MKSILVLVMLLSTYIPSKEMDIGYRSLIRNCYVEPQPHEIILNGLVAVGIDTFSAKVMVAQASFESGGFSNSLTRKSNNCFAIHYTSCRPTYAYSGGGEAEGHNKFARFATLDSAARDFPYFLKYLKVSNKIKSIDNYAAVLKAKGYYGSSEQLYSNGIKVHYRKIFGIIPSK